MAVDIMQLMNDVQNSYSSGEQAGKKRRSDMLFGQAAQGDQSALKSLFGVDPQTAYSLQEKQTAAQKTMHDDVANLMHRGAQAIVDAPDSDKAYVFDGVRREILRHPEGAQYLNDIPDKYTPDLLPQIRSMAAVSGIYSPEDKGAMVQSTKVGNDGYYYTVDRSGNWVKSNVRADQNLKTIETDQGINTFNPNGGATAPLMEGGSSPSSPPITQGNAPPATVNPNEMEKEKNMAIQRFMIEHNQDPNFGSLPSATKYQIAVKFLQSSQDGTDFSVQVPPQQGQRVQPAKKDLKPEAQPEFKQKIDYLVAQGFPKIEATKMVLGDKSAAGASASKPPTEDQNKAAGYGQRMERALADAARYEKTDPTANRPDLKVAALDMLPDSIANYAKSESRQNIEAAQMDALDAALTLNTGAAYTKEQLKSLAKAYFPQPGNPENVIEEKKKRLQGLIETARLRARGAYPDASKPTESDANATLPRMDGVKRLKYNPATGKIE